MTESLFPAVADALRKVAEEHGYEVYVSAKTGSITLTKQGRSRVGREDDFHVKVRQVPKPAAKPRKTKAQLEQELAAERKRRQDAERDRASLKRRLDPPDYSYFGLGDGPT